MDKLTDLTCRVCLNVEELMIHIYEEVEDLSTDLGSLLEQCGDLKVDRSDNYPKYLCKECTSELLIAAKFREKCSRSKEILQQYEEVHLQDSKYLVEEQESINVELTKNMEDDTTYLEESPQTMNLSEENKVDESETNLLPLDFLMYPDIDKIVSNDVDSINTSEFQLKLNHEIDETGETDETSIDETAVIAVAIQQEAEELRNFAKEIIEYDRSDQNDCLAKNHTNKNTLFGRQPDNIQSNVEKFDASLALSERISNLRFKCDLCGAAFVSAQNLKRHINISHIPLQLFHCPHCFYCFSLEENFIKHSNICASKINASKEAIDDVKRCGRRKKAACLTEDVTCCYCKKICKNNFALNMHLRTHTGERPFKCSECPKSFKTRSTLGSHMKRHGGVPDYICTFCNKTFFESTNLQAHIRTHTGEKPHRCTVCDKRFTRVFLLQLHMRTHTGEKPYACPHCKRSFAQLCDMKNHIRTHTGERQFKCSLCSKSFIKRRPFLWHMERHAALKDISERKQLKQQQIRPSKNCSNEEESQCSLLSMKFDLDDLIVEDHEEEEYEL